MGSEETVKLAGDVQGTGPGQARDKRADILGWIAEQEALCAAATKGPWTLAPLSGGQISVRASHTGLGGEHFDATLAAVEIYDEDEPADEGQWHANARIIASSRTVLPLALAALRAEVEPHERLPEWRNAEDVALGIELGCYCGSRRPAWPCPTINRIHAAIFGEDK